MSEYDFLMGEALNEAKAALDDGEFPVGCVIALDGDVISRGRRKGSGIETETDHAEVLAIRELYRSGWTVDWNKLVIYATMEPCLMCFGAILISGIGKIVYSYEDVMGGGTSCDLSILPPLYNESKIQVVPGIRRDEGLRLFKEFFSSPDNNYLRGTLLAEHALQS